LKEAVPPVTANTPSRMPDTSRASTGKKMSIEIGAMYGASFNAISAWAAGAPASTCCFMTRSRPTSVDRNTNTVRAVMTVHTASIPPQRGKDTTDSYVDLGDVSMPKNRWISDSGAAPLVEADRGCVIG